MCHCVGIVEVTLAVIDDFHVALDALIAINRPALHLNPHDGQVGRGEFYFSITGRVIVGRLMLASHEHRQQHCYENHSSHNHR